MINSKSDYLRQIKALSRETEQQWSQIEKQIEAKIEEI